jgi:hypothetical protein
MLQEQLLMEESSKYDLQERYRCETAEFKEEHARLFRFIDTCEAELFAQSCEVAETENSAQLLGVIREPAQKAQDAAVQTLRPVLFDKGCQETNVTGPQMLDALLVKDQQDQAQTLEGMVPPV